MVYGNEIAAICGLFCGTCSYYPDLCKGCLSDSVAPGCDTCGNGFRECAAEHGIIRCFECGEFPCSRLEIFSKQHIVNGICHHEHVIADLQRMGDIGVEAFVEEQVQSHTCSCCGQIIPWFETVCPKCNI